MFERYTEQARRTLFFTRYETFDLGGVAIETEHLLLGAAPAGFAGAGGTSAATTERVDPLESLAYKRDHHGRRVEELC